MALIRKPERKVVFGTGLIVILVTVTDDLIIKHEMYEESFDWDYDLDNYLTSITNGSTSAK